MKTAPQAKQAQRTQRLESLRQSGAPIAGRCGWISASGLQCTRKDAHFGGHSCEQAHTPTPWQQTDRAFGGGQLAGGSVITRATNGNVIPPGTSPFDMLIAENVKPATAAFIVRACNSHDALVAALRDIAADAEYGLARDDLMRRIAAKASAVLAKAEA